MGLFSSKCDNCGSTEHSTSDCPHGLLSSKCAKCGSVDHSTSDCPHGIFSTKCSKCGSTEHSSSDCPHGIFSTKCAKCGSTEHSTSDCPHGVFSSRCSKCGSKNHSTADCPQGMLGKSAMTTILETSSSDSSSNEGGCVKIIGWLIGIGILVFVVVWLAVNVVLPITLLNSALALTVLALVFKKYKALFASLALVGGGYLLIDVTNGWLSDIFVEKVVKNTDWISAFVYLNAAAIGLSTWILIQPIWLKTKQMELANKWKRLLIRGAIILLTIIATVVAPVFYHSVQNPFTQKVIHNQTSPHPQTKNQNNETENGDSRIQSTMIENQIIVDTYIGTIGIKDFKLCIEKVDSVNVEGYNVTGKNKRPVKGRIVDIRTEANELGGNYAIFKINLTEPGDDKWDGEFNIELWISDNDRHGNGSWKSYNGKLERQIVIKDRLNE